MSRARLLIGAIATAALAGCAQTPRPFTTLSTASTPLCQFSGQADVSSAIDELHEAVAITPDSQKAGQLLDTIRQRFDCRSPAQMRVMYSYTVEDPDVSQPLPHYRCISVSGVALGAGNPFYEEWLACDQAADVLYVVDFNNILTRNEPIDDRLRIREAVRVTPSLARVFGGDLPIRRRIRDLDGLLYDAVAYRLPEGHTLVEDSYTIATR